MMLEIRFASATYQLVARSKLGLTVAQRSISDEKKKKKKKKKFNSVVVQLG